MFKKIHVRQLEIGMFIHEFCGSWADHPFWRSSFLLQDPNDLKQIRNCSIQEIWIDTRQGKDVDAGFTHDEEEASFQEQIREIISEQDLATELRPEVRRKTSFSHEIRHAQRLCEKARDEVAHMFHDVRMGRAIDSNDAIGLIDAISDSIMRNSGALLSLVRLKTADNYTYMHSMAVCALMVGLARQMGLTEDQTLLAGKAGLFHDMGKANIPGSILNKPGQLSEDEFEIVRYHPEVGYRLLLTAKGIEPSTLQVCLEHHEKMDGTGYPRGKKGEQISIYSRMAAICDVYDAVTSNRPYKPGWDPAAAIHKMAGWTGHFDGRIFQAFVKTVGIYPVGSLVRMESQRLGVVQEQGDGSLLQPKIRVFYSLKNNAYIQPEVIDLSKVRDKIMGREDPAAAKIPLKTVNQMWLGVEA